MEWICHSRRRLNVVNKAHAGSRGNLRWVDAGERSGSVFERVVHRDGASACGVSLEFTAAMDADAAAALDLACCAHTLRSCSTFAFPNAPASFTFRFELLSSAVSCLRASFNKSRTVVPHSIEKLSIFCSSQCYSLLKGRIHLKVQYIKRKCAD